MTRELLVILYGLVAAWDGVRDDEIIPDSLNDEQMWDEARAILAVSLRRMADVPDMPDIFEEIE